MDEEFKKQRARTVRDLAEKATDPFIKAPSALGVTYEAEGPKPPTTLTPIDLQFASRGDGARTITSLAMPMRYDHPNGSDTWVDLADDVSREIAAQLDEAADAAPPAPASR